MDFFYFFVTSHGAWDDACGYHKHYFNELNTFTWALFALLLLGAACSAAFYFSCCNGKSNKNATRTNWVIGLVLTIVLGWSVSHFVFFGGENSGFAAANQEYYTQICKDNPDDNNYQEQASNVLATIQENIIYNRDVALIFDLTNVLWSLLWYLLASLAFKRMTVHGSEIPF